MKMKRILIALIGVSTFTLGCDNAFKFQQIPIACEPPASSARFGKNSGPVIMSPTANEPFNTAVTVKGTCVDGYSVEIRGRGLKTPAITECQLGEFSFSVNFNEGDGTKEIDVAQKTFNGEDITDRRCFSQDTVPPKVTITASTGEQALSNKTLRLVGLCESGLDVEISGPQLTNSVKTLCNSGHFQAPITFTGEDGLKNVIAQQVDRAGNRGDDDQIYKTDTVAPDVRINSPDALNTSNGNLNLVGVCESGIPVLLQGAIANTVISIPCEKGQFSSPVTLSAGDGIKNITASQTDLAGNTNSANRDFIKDSVAPLVTITAPAVNSYIDATATISGSCESGLAVTLSGPGVVSPVSTICAASTFSVSVNFTSGDSVKLITASQTDAVGNSGTNSRSLIRDSTAPEIKILSPDAGSVFHSSLTLKGSCESGLVVTIGGTGVNTTSLTNCTTGTFSTTITLSNSDGIKVISAAQTDGANHVGSDSREFIRDSTPPDVKITSPLSGLVSDVNIVLAGTCENGLEVVLSGSGLTTPSAVMCAENKFSIATKLTSSSGNKIVTATQTDIAKNMGTDSKTYIVDSNSPVVIITGPPIGTRAVTGVTLTGTCKSGLNVLITGDINISSTTACNNGGFSTNILFSPVVGAKQITASQTDAGNRTGKDTRTFVRANNAGYETYSSRGPGGKVDILFVDDNSSSMEAEQAALGSRFSSFTTQLEDVDWQAGIITTDCTNGSPYNFCGQLFDFKLRPIGEYILSALTPDFLNAFKETIQRDETVDCWRADSLYPCPASNEEGLKSTIESFQKRNTDNAGFFRNDSDLAVVYLSDENEQSTGPVGATTPTDVISAFKSTWGTTKKLSAYAIIIKPGDSTCLDKQKKQPAGGLSSNYGTFQDQLATMTGGLSVSICEPDYSITLQKIGQDVTRLSKSYDLPQTPITGSVKVAFDGVTQATTIYSVSGNRVTFTEVPALGTKVEIFYEF